MPSKKLLIAIDGPSSSGKGTIAKKIANHFHLPYLNTGALYRFVAYQALQENLNLEKDIEKILPLIKKLNLNDSESPKLHNEEIGKAASIVAKDQKIRKALFDLQRNFAIDGLSQDGGAVLDGRDIGTIICPDANYKFFITASDAVRADRRYKQLIARGENISYENILSQIKARDEQDKNRKEAPLVKAADAITIDTSDMNIEQVFNTLLSYINS